MTEDELHQWFDAHGFAVEQVEHPATHRVEDGLTHRVALPGAQTKSLLVEDKAGGLTLIVARGASRIDLKALGKVLAVKGRFSFAKEERMVSALGVRPGTATPLALSHPGASKIAHVVVEDVLRTAAQIWCHPLRNTASIGLSPQALDAFINHHWGPPTYLSVAATDAPE